MFRFVTILQYFFLTSIVAKKTRRRLQVESLEGRQLLAADVGLGYETPEPPALVASNCVVQPVDVNNDGNVTPLDALIVINKLYRDGGITVGYDYSDQVQTTGDTAFYDVNLDSRVTALDALIVLNWLHQYGAGPIERPCEPPVETGNLFVTLDATPVRSQYLLGGTVSEPIVRINAQAVNESIELAYISFTVDGADSVDRLELYRNDAVTPFALLSRAGVQSQYGDDFGGTFSFGQVVLPELEDVDILVRPRIKSDNVGGLSGTTVQATLNTVVAYGVESSNYIQPNNGDNLATGEVFIGTNVPGPNNPVSGPEHTVVMAKVTSVTNANPAADGTLVPTGIAPTGQFTITTASHSNSGNALNDVLADLLTFVITTSDLELDTSALALYNKADASVQSSEYTATDLGSGSYEVTFSGLVASGVNTEIDNGASETFVLSTNVLSAGPNASLEVSMLTDKAVWLDQDAGGFVSYQGFKLVDPVVKSTMYRN